ncbi:hypothetical protein B0I37DRAFT_380805 [Chaetomium sp. MPI-CAGE-AT-0009]|nr:hypothetical protein B0I37DRAFT_380805 [Chaetomium sp. MPI-CAGE-AT-0009]
MKPAIIIVALAQCANVVTAECIWHQCWERLSSNGLGGLRGSDVCKDKCPPERWRSRVIWFTESWGCRLDDKYERDRKHIADYKKCCSAQGSGYHYTDVKAC